MSDFRWQHRQHRQHRFEVRRDGRDMKGPQLYKVVQHCPTNIDLFFFLGCPASPFYREKFGARPLQTVSSDEATLSVALGGRRFQVPWNFMSAWSFGTTVRFDFRNATVMTQNASFYWKPANNKKKTKKQQKKTNKRKTNIKNKK